MLGTRLGLALLDAGWMLGRLDPRQDALNSDIEERRVTKLGTGLDW